MKNLTKLVTLLACCSMLGAGSVMAQGYGGAGSGVWPPAGGGTGHGGGMSGGSLDLEGVPPGLGWSTGFDLASCRGLLTGALAQVEGSLTVIHGQLRIQIISILRGLFWRLFWKMKLIIWYCYKWQLKCRWVCWMYKRCRTQSISLIAEVNRLILAFNAMKSSLTMKCNAALDELRAQHQAIADAHNGHLDTLRGLISALEAACDAVVNFPLQNINLVDNVPYCVEAPNETPQVDLTPCPPLPPCKFLRRCRIPLRFFSAEDQAAPWFLFCRNQGWLECPTENGGIGGE